MDLKQAALSYVAKGLIVIPLCRPIEESTCYHHGACKRPGKTPLFGSWTKFYRPPNERNIEEWLQKWPDPNLGILTGGPKHLVVLDVDGETGKQSIDGKEIPKTPTNMTGRGVHHLFHSPFPVGNHTGIMPGVDIRGECGLFVAPPSKHYLGVEYKWQEGLSLDDVSIAQAPSWLLELLKAKEDQRQESANGGPQEKWLQEILQGVEESNRNDAATRLAGYFFNKGLPIDIVRTEMIFWNQRNRPPLTEAELFQTINSIDRKEQAKNNDENRVIKARTLELKSIVDLLNEPEQPIDWLIEPLLESGKICFIAGEPKSTKSLFALYLALCISTRTPVLDKFEVPKKRKVLFLEEEDDAGLVKRRTHLLSVGHKLPLPEPESLKCIVRADFRIDDDSFFNELKRQLAKFRPEVLIVDVLARVHSHDENNQKEMTEVMRRFEELRREFSCAIIILHHNRKPSQHDYYIRGSQKMRGSSVLGGWSENSLYISKSGDSFKIEYESKNGPVKPFTYIIEEVKGENGKPQSLRLVFKETSDFQREAKQEEAVLEALKNSYVKSGKEACTPVLIAPMVNFSSANTVRKYCKVLVAKGKVRPETTTNAKNQKTTCYIPIESHQDRTDQDR